MSEYRYILEKTSKKLFCPSCSQKRYTRFIDTEKDEYLPNEYGRCDRIDNCTYSLNPYQDGYSKMIFEKERGGNTNNWKPKVYAKPPPPPKPKTSFIELEILKESLTYGNHFLTFLNNRFGVEVTDRLIEKYLIGSSKHWKGATVFWQIDTKGKIRSGKIMLYNPETGKRVKEPFNHITWIHMVKRRANFELEQCFFGEHLLKGNNKPIGVLESEKSAIIASIFFPEYVWIAVGSLTNLNETKCQILKGRTVTLFPDLKAYDRWADKQKEISEKIPEIRFTRVSDLLERKAPETVKEGYDLADFLLREEQPSKIIEPIEKKVIVKKKSSFTGYIDSIRLENKVLISSNGYPITWDLYGNDADEKTKVFIRMAEKNSELIKLNKIFQCDNF
jgi:hypothetical protein